MENNNFRYLRLSNGELLPSHKMVGKVMGIAHNYGKEGNPLEYVIETGHYIPIDMCEEADETEFK